mmetsp:Transcript_3336/g.7237  ORF Transcript_3336/g.7237 Transcript_3336/m.7237 type:complete len:204 (+) Transcript_3336:271-882(+)
MPCHSCILFFRLFNFGFLFFRVFNFIFFYFLSIRFDFRSKTVAAVPSPLSGIGIHIHAMAETMKRRRRRIVSRPLPSVHERVSQSGFVAARGTSFGVAAAADVAVVRFLRHSCRLVCRGVRGATRIVGRCRRRRRGGCRGGVVCGSAPPAPASVAIAIAIVVGVVEQEGGGLPIPAEIVNGNGYFLSNLGFLVLGVALHVYPR